MDACFSQFSPFFSVSLCDSPSLPLPALNLSLWYCLYLVFSICASPPRLLSLPCLSLCTSPCVRNSPPCVCVPVFFSLVSPFLSLALCASLPAPVGQSLDRTPSQPLPLSIPPGALPPPPCQFPCPRLSLQPLKTGPTPPTPRTPRGVATARRPPSGESRRGAGRMGSGPGLGGLRRGRASGKRPSWPRPPGPTPQGPAPLWLDKSGGSSSTPQPDFSAPTFGLYLSLRPSAPPWISPPSTR